MTKFFVALVLSLAFLHMPKAHNNSLEETLRESCKKVSDLAATPSLQQSSEQNITLAKVLEQLEKINKSLEGTRSIEQPDNQAYRVLLQEKENTITQLRLIEAINQLNELEQTPFWLTAIQVLGITTTIIGISSLFALACYDQRTGTFGKPSTSHLEKNFDKLVDTLARRNKPPLFDFNANIRVGRFWD
ncbi:hypothetical protein K2X40_04345 [Candidatus Babeliales bacterium]|nr:hypothetical protein [Candidatus Babeliales bacterium]